MISIRKIEQHDAKMVKNLINGIMESEFPMLNSVYGGDDIDNPVSYYGGKKDMFFVAEKDGIIIGTIGIKEDSSSTALLRRLFVKKEYRGKGYGIKLVDHAVEFAKTHHYKKIIFRGTDLMKAAFNACLKSGFKEKDILALPHVKMVMLEKKLD